CRLSGTNRSGCTVDPIQSMSANQHNVDRLVTRGVMMKTTIMLGLAAIIAITQPVLSAERTQNFDTDPNWEGVNNRMTPSRMAQVTQDFGYSQTHFAGEAGEMGG